MQTTHQGIINIRTRQSIMLLLNSKIRDMNFVDEVEVGTMVHDNVSFTKIIIPLPCLFLSLLKMV